MKRIWSFTPTKFKRTGFVGGLNWYRNIDETWELTGFLEGAKLRQPSLFIAGDKDPVIEFYADWYKNIAEIMRERDVVGRGSLDAAGASGRSQPAYDRIS